MNIDPIDALLCDCLGRVPDIELIAKLNLLSLTEWEALWQRACRQHVPALLYRRVKALKLTQPFPKPILEKMQSTAINDAVKSIQQHHALSKLLGAFRNKGIPVIVLKGAYLGEIIYHNIALRSMGDIDLMVQKTDLASTIEMLHELGYESRFVPSFQAQVTSNNELFPFRKPGSPPVDIHWALEMPDTPFKIDVSELWQRAKEESVAGVLAKVLAPEDLFLHLCLHNASRHLFVMGLRNLCDIHEVMLQFSNSLDWQQVLEKAHQWNASRCLYLNLYLARELLGAEIPSKILEQMKPKDFGPEIEQNILDRLFIEKIHSEIILPPLARVWGSRRIKDTLAVLFTYAFPKPDILASIFSIELSTPRIYFYYPLRWLYLLRRWGRFVWRLIFRERKAVALLEIMKKNIATDDWLTNWLASESRAVAVGDVTQPDYLAGSHSV